MSASFAKASNILQNFETSVTYVEQFDLTSCAIWDEEKEVCLSTEGIHCLMSNVARLTAQGWIYLYMTQETHDPAIYKLHYQAPLG